MSRVSLIGMGICAASLVAYAAGCSHDSAKPFVEWAADACTCKNKECIEEARAELPKLYEDMDRQQLIDKRIILAEEMGASCLEIYGIEVERRLGDSVRRVQAKR